MEAVNTVEQSKELVKSLFRVPLRVFILYLIAKHGELHGYEIMKKIEELTFGLWKPSPSTLYMVLNNLVKEGYLEKFVEYRGRVERIKYRVTKKGLEVLKLSLEMVLRIIYTVAQHLEELSEKLRSEKPSTEAINTLNNISRYLQLLEKLRSLLERRIEELRKHVH